jgi:hypothetical protein
MHTHAHTHTRTRMCALLQPHTTHNNDKNPHTNSLVSAFLHHHGSRVGDVGLVELTVVCVCVCVCVCKPGVFSEVDCVP